MQWLSQVKSRLEKGLKTKSAAHEVHLEKIIMLHDNRCSVRVKSLKSLLLACARLTKLHFQKLDINT